MALSAGTRLGPYEILAPLGAGGMGEVYRARDTRLGREVAVKVLPATFAADADRMRRFEQEARAAGMLNHPNILAIYDVGTHEGSPYLVSELLEGDTLRELAAIPQRKALDYAQQMARGLAAAHEKGITHRDLKPENVFVTRDERVKILDFGLAKLTQIEESLTNAPTTPGGTLPGAVLGTAGYMSPEQVMGRPADHRSDIFSLGAILYEMLSGRRAFSGDTTVETMHAILKTDPPELPHPGWERVVRRCLEKRPEQRFQAAGDVAFTLEAVSGLSSAVGQAFQPVPARMPAVFFRVVVLAVLAVGVALGHFLWKTPSAEQPVFHQVTYRRGTIFSARFAPDGQTIVYSAAWDGQPVEILAARHEYPESRSLGLSSSTVLAISPSTEMAVLKDARFLHHYQWTGTLAGAPLGGGAPRELLENVLEADWAPDGSGLAVVRQEGGKTRLEYPMGKVLYETAGWISDPRVSPKGDRVAFLDHPIPMDDRGSVTVVDRPGKTTILSKDWERATGLAWAPSGEEVWFSATKAGLATSLYAVTWKSKQRQVLRGAGGLRLHDIARDGRLLVSRTNRRASVVAMIAGQRQERDLSWLDASGVPYLSTDAKLLLFTESGEAAGPRYAVCLRKTDGSPVIRLGEGHGEGLSPDGKWALSSVFSSPPQLVLLPTGAGQAMALEQGGMESYAWAGWFPDGKRILFVGNEAGRRPRAYLQEVAGGPPRPVLPEGMLPVAKAISPDGRLVVCQREDQMLMLCALEGGAAQPQPGLLPGDSPLTWTPDGRYLYVKNRQDMTLRVYRVEIPGGRRQLWKEVMPSDRAGFLPAWGHDLSLTPDGQSLAYRVNRELDDLFVVEGVK